MYSAPHSCFLIGVAIIMTISHELIIPIVSRLTQCKTGPMRSKQELGLAIFRLKQNLKRDGVNCPDQLLFEMANDVLERKVREVMDQTIESWPIGDVPAFMHELQNPEVQQITKPDEPQLNEANKKRSKKTAH